ncbi:hypothetical protein [Mycobacterium antarcticum]|nr:hypothetical protein [Mycolicibacterium sp. TUM20984]
MLRPDLGPYGWFKVLDDYIENRREEADGVPDSELGRFSDDELIHYTEQQIIFEELYNRDVCFPGFFMLCRDSMAALGQIVNQWYTGDNEHAFTHLVTGTPEATWTVREHIALWRLATHIRENAELSSAFETRSGGEFFDYAAKLESATEFTAGIEMSGHRGHADRDIYYTRYAEDPAVLYSALASHLKSDDNPLEQERRNNELRNAAYEDVLSNIARPARIPQGRGVQDRARLRDAVLDLPRQRTLADRPQHLLDKEGTPRAQPANDGARPVRDRA